MAASLAASPASAQMGEALGQNIRAACTGVTWAEMDAGGDRFVACLVATEESLAMAVNLPAADQEHVGLAFADVLRAPVEAGAPVPVPAASSLITRYLQNMIMFCSPQTFPGACDEAVRFTAVIAQAQSAETIAAQIADICGAVAAYPARRGEFAAIVDPLAARGATGADPVMRGRIDAFQAGVAACP